MAEVVVRRHPGGVRGGEISDVRGEAVGHPDAMEWPAEVAASKPSGPDTEFRGLSDGEWSSGQGRGERMIAAHPTTVRHAGPVWARVAEFGG
ncbi:hypothetical protein ACVXZ4_17370 [Lacisediminihabitans sp. FW035]